MYRALTVLGWLAVFSPSAQAGLEIIDLGTTYQFDSAVTPSWLRNHIERDNDVIGGNTSIRNETADSLDWKGDPNANGYGYYQRNRDLGQVINIPAGEEVKIDAIVLRTGRGNNAIMAGAPGAKMYVQFFEVVEVPGATLRINENGTTKGQRATHGFDRKYNRADDFVEGVAYVPIARITGGVFPPGSPPTTRYAYRHRSGEPFGVQPGHLRYFRFDLKDDDEIVLQGGKRYVFMIGFDEPGRDRGLGIAITTKVHTLEAAEFDKDSNGEVRWAVRREGDGTLPPTMLDTTEPPSDANLRDKLIDESMFQPNHWDTLRPTSDGYPDVDTYMTRQFYVETKPTAREQTSNSDSLPLPDREAPSSDTAAQLAHWATLPPNGPAGRPLPLAGNWMVEDPAERRKKGESPLHWGPAYMVELIRKGHHVLTSFIDPFANAKYAYLLDSDLQIRRAEATKERWKPILEYCREHRLPIAIRGWNWDTYPAVYQEFQRRAGQEISPEDDVRLFIQGRPHKIAVDPLGPVEPWRELGRFWLGNPMIRWMQEVYPDPPLVIMLNNNEAGAVHNLRELMDSDRYVVKYGLTNDINHAKQVKEAGYCERRVAMLNAARQAAAEGAPGWGKAVRFVAYNSIWNTMEAGRKRIAWPVDGYPVPKEWDGSMLELYDNDWQLGKTDFRVWSMQAEAMNTAGFLPEILRQAPDFFWSNITWDGAPPSNVYRPRGGANTTSGKPFYYITRGEHWDASRFEGWTQYGIWVTRPRLWFEFRGGRSRDAYETLTWQTTLDVVDRPWGNPVLREFWQFGELVPNRDERPYWGLQGDEPQWLQKLDRWFLLSCSANPPRSTVDLTLTDDSEEGHRLPDEILEESQSWEATTKISVWALAMKLGDSPRRRWLIYAHAPMGGIADSTVRLPEFGDVVLDEVPVSGSFFLVDEATKRVTAVHRGGPAEVTLRTAEEPIEPGERVSIAATVSVAPSAPFGRFCWEIDGHVVARQSRLENLEHTFERVGIYVVTVKGLHASDELVLGECAVRVALPVDEATAYSLPLDHAFQRSGPWGATGDEEETLVTYRHLPNAGHLPPPVLTGGRFVADTHRGRVLQFDGGDEQGVWLIADKHTVMVKDVSRSKTVSFWINPAETKTARVLYAEGNPAIGANVYLDNGCVFAGAWNRGGDAPWDGTWIQSAPISANEWTEITFAMKADEPAGKMRMTLHTDGDHAGDAEGKLLESRYTPPRIGTFVTNRSGILMTRFHDGMRKADVVGRFRGFLDDFALVSSSDAKPHAAP